MQPPIRARRVRTAERRRSRITAQKVGVFFGSQGGTNDVLADIIIGQIQNLHQPARPETVAGDGDDPDFMSNFFMDERDQSELLKYPAIVVGALPKGELTIDLTGKRVAVWGHGDAVGDAATFVDSMGANHDVLRRQGGTMFGYVDADDYLHDKSRAERGGKLVGLAVDSVNEDDETLQRMGDWIDQLAAEGFFNTGKPLTPEEVASARAAGPPDDPSSASASASASAPAPAPAPAFAPTVTVIPPEVIEREAELTRTAVQNARAAVQASFALRMTELQKELSEARKKGL